MFVISLSRSGDQNQTPVLFRSPLRPRQLQNVLTPIMTVPLSIHITIASQTVERNRRSKRHKSEANTPHETRRRIDRWDNKCGIMDGRRRSANTREGVERGMRSGIMAIVRNASIRKGWGICLREGLEGYLWGYRWHYSVHSTTNKESIGVGSGIFFRELTVEAVVGGH